MKTFMGDGGKIEAAASGRGTDEVLLLTVRDALLLNETKFNNQIICCADVGQQSKEGVPNQNQKSLFHPFSLWRKC